MSVPENDLSLPSENQAGNILRHYQCIDWERESSVKERC